MFEPAELLKCIGALLRIDAEWVPKAAASSCLYIRPLMMATDTSIGLKIPSKAMLLVMSCPVADSYYTPLNQPQEDTLTCIRLKAENRMVRAWPGGTGSYKISGNYAPTLLAQKKASAEGFDQVLWLFEGKVTEAGTMNTFFVLAAEGGGYKLVTLGLQSGLILPGVTRESVLELARAFEGIEVLESETLSIDDLAREHAHERLVEAFATGTAASLCQIGEIVYEDATGRSKSLGIASIGFAQKLLEDLRKAQQGHLLAQLQQQQPWSLEITPGFSQ